MAALVCAVTFFCFPLLGSKVHFANAMCLLSGLLVGALTYVALYMLKTFIYQRFIHGFPVDAVWVTMWSKLSASLLNAVAAMIAAPILYSALRPALE